MHRPRIGMPLCLDDRERWRPGHEYVYADRRYADALSRAGGLVLQLPIQAEPESLIGSLDGLLLPGGDDLPSETPLADDVSLDLVPQAQLDFDVALLQAAIAARMPILGICYGMQLLATVAGARLIAHLPSQCPSAEDHKLASPDARHPIELEPESRLARLWGTTTCAVNSLHHQAIGEVGAAHRVVARSPDGVIEAIEPRDPEAPFQVGVQWHPEKLDAPESDRLFEHFVASCREAAR